MSISKEKFGIDVNGVDVYKYQITNKNGGYVEVISIGATLVKLVVPNKNNELIDVVLGFDGMDTYNTNPYFGSTVGRCCNRIENARFMLNGEQIKLVKNEGRNQLHGGPLGLSTYVWNHSEKDENSVEFAVFSPSGAEGYPGNLDVSVCYTFDDENNLTLEYKGSSDADTILNLTNHAYFNLGGHDSGDVLNDKLMIDADSYSENGKKSIPTGNLIDVSGTPYDFREEKCVGLAVNDNHPQIEIDQGIDTNFVLNKNDYEYKLFATLSNEETGIKMQAFTTEPCVQIYTGNHIKPESNVVGKNGFLYNKHCGICLETQRIPDAINKNNEEQVILRKGSEYTQKTTYSFTNI